MRLLLADREVEDPTAEDVRRELQSLRHPDPFAILEREPDHYLQAYKGSSGRFSVEFQAGGLEFGYESPDTRHGDEVLAAFLSYLEDDTAWQTQFEWRRRALPGTSTAPPARPRPSALLPRGTVAVLDDRSEEDPTADATVLLAFVSAADSSSRALAPHLAEVARLRGDRLSVAAIDVDASPASAAAWGVSMLPTLVLLQDGLLLRVLRGVRPAARLVEELDQALAPEPR